MGDGKKISINSFARDVICIERKSWSIQFFDLFFVLFSLVFLVRCPHPHSMLAFNHIDPVQNKYTELQICIVCERERKMIKSAKLFSIQYVFVDQIYVRICNLLTYRHGNVVDKWMLVLCRHQYYSRLVSQIDREEKMCRNVYAVKNYRKTISSWAVQPQKDN